MIQHMLDIMPGNYWIIFFGVFTALLVGIWCDDREL